MSENSHFRVIQLPIFSVAPRQPQIPKADTDSSKNVDFA